VGDCDKLAAASRCSAVIEAERVPLPPGLAGSRDAELIARLLTAGEDFEVLAVIRPEKAARFIDAAKRVDVPVTRIGTLIDGTDLTKLVFEGISLSLSQRAFVHGRVGPAK
jgi:thiamine monophosphate kinase